MAWGEGQKPSYKSEPITLEQIKQEAEKHKDWSSFASFVEFLEKLDPIKTAIFYVEENGTHSGRIGYKVIHFNEKVEEKWHDSWGQTWFCISGWMS